MWFEVLQGVFTATDTSTAASWREEDRTWVREERHWRSEDLQWRENAFSSKVNSLRFAEDQEGWRESDLTQRNLENSRILWKRFVDKNRREVEEKTTNLKAVSSIAAVFAGFSVVSLTQLKVVYPGNPLALFAIYAILTAATAGSMVISLVASTLLLGSILKKGKLYVSEEAEEEFIQSCFAFSVEFQVGDRAPQPRRSFESFWEMRCEPTWQLSLFCLRWGIASFLVSLGPIGWLVFTSDFLTVVLWLIALGAVICLWLHGQYIGSPGRGALTVPKPVHSESMGGLPFDWHRAPN